MRIPKKIKIGGHWFSITFKSEKRDDWDKSGAKFGWKGIIILQKDAAQSKRVSILLHEIIHEISWQNDLDLREPQVSSLAEGLYQVLADNKLLRG